MKYSNRLISTLLIGGGLFNLAAPVLALGTAAGQDIKNTATATYEDPSGATSNTTSNTVTVTVAEVAGITINAGTVTNTGATQVTNAAPVAVTTALKENDNVVFEFDLINTGNDTTDFFVPNQAQVSNSPATVKKVQYFKATAPGVGTWEDVSTLTNNLVTKNSTNGGVIKPGDVVKVRVLVTVNAGTTTGDINVTLGNTGQSNLQNADFASNGGDVYTIDRTTAVPGEEVDGAPSNGVREAAATGKTTVNPQKQAFAKVTKTHGAVYDTSSSAATTTATVTDDKVSYTLGLDVAANAPLGSTLVAEDLAGTAINLQGQSAASIVSRVLVSDALPTGTALISVGTAPSGWTAVYSSTPIVAGVAANDASVLWKELPTAPTVAELASVTRIGYINAGPITKGTSVTGLKFDVALNVAAAGGSVLNIAQVFGTTSNAGAADLTKPVVDESGDAQYNNLNPDGSPGSAPTNGVATNADGVDGGNDNTGTGTGGEANIINIAPPAPTDVNPIFNGPEGKPEAKGPGGSQNNDFTNKSVTIDAAQAGWTVATPGNPSKPNPVNPQSMAFANSVSQAAGGTRPQYIALLPTAPANKTDLPDLTSVKITANGVTVAYIYDQTAGTFSPVILGTLPLNLTVPVTGSANYGVDVDLPDGSAQITGFPVSITAFSNGAPAVFNNLGVKTDEPIVGNNTIEITDAQNITIDRLYTGYLKMFKEAKVSKADGTTVSDFSASAPKAAPGEYIEYRIKYSNISDTVPVGSNSVGLAAKNIQILENGTAGGNNWGDFTTNKPSSAADNNGGVISFGGKSTTDADVAEYLNKVSNLEPQTTGAFSFTRQVK